jgi:hypothetical protein
LSERFVVEQRGEWWHLPIAGMRVGRCFFEPGGFGLIAYVDHESSELSLGSPIHVPERGETRTLAVEESGAAEALRHVLEKTVEVVRVSSTSRLGVLFEDGVSLASDPLPDVEARQVLGPGGVKAFAGTGGGEPGIWDDSSPTYSFGSPD